MTARSDMSPDPTMVGAAAGTAVGPITAAVGGVAGAVVGGLLGKAAADSQDNQNVIDVLDDLIEACRDREYGFNACAEYLDAGALKERFHLRATQCRDAAAELGIHVLRLGGKPDDAGTARGAVHRGWMAVQGTLSSHGEWVMLEECERGEDLTLRRYRRALCEALPSDLRALITQQLQNVQHSHDDIKRLRDEARSHA